MPHETQFEWSNTNAARLLVQASEAFVQLEELVYGAKHEVWLGFRVFDPQTALRSQQRSPTLRTWADLLAEKAQQGVSVRLLLADFEPILTPHLHQQSWSSVLGFLKKTEDAKTFQIICAQHPAKFAPLMQAILWPWFIKKLWGLQRDIRSGDIDLKTTPGLRRYFDKGGVLTKQALLRPAKMHPVTHHQKLAVVDGAAAIVGGLDVDERRYDTQGHDRSAKDTWQDASVLVQGQSASDLRTHFISCWNEEMQRHTHRRRLTRLARDHDLNPHPASPLDKESAGIKGIKAPMPVKVIRTLSRNSNGLVAIRPTTTHDEIMQETLQIFGESTRSLYIETQFFRSLMLAKALAKRAEQQSKLTCILLLPFAPEEIAFDKHHHPAHKHGEWLQGRCLKILKKAFGERLGVFSLAKPEEADTETGRAKAYDAGVIHLHSKLLLADDERMTTTSANLNGRSLKWDTEVGVSITDPDFVQSTRQKLWHKHLQDEAKDAYELNESLNRWKDIAFTNVSRAPSDRQGFILPHQSARTIRYGRPAIFIPDEMV